MPPLVTSCPGDIRDTIRLGVPGVLVDWPLPQATDDVGPVRLLSVTQEPRTVFLAGRTPVSYVFADAAGNKATCNFTVIVEEIGEQTVEYPASCTLNVIRLARLNMPLWPIGKG